MSRLPRRTRVRIHPYVEPAVAQLLAEYSTATGIPTSAVVQEALRKHLDRTGDMDLILRRLNRLGRALERMHRDHGFLAEAFGVFVRLWFAHTPSVADNAKDLARRTAETRFRQFIEHVVERFTGGPRFFDHLPREVLADEVELEKLAAQPSRISGPNEAVAMDDEP